MAINDVLSVFRQSLASERQSRISEMQLALSALQYESQREFREMGRQREDAIFALQKTEQSTREALSQDAMSIYTRLSSLAPIATADRDDNGMLKKTSKIITELSKPVNKKGKYGFTESQATEIVNVVNNYDLSRTNPDLIKTAQESAVNFGRKVSRDYGVYKLSEFQTPSKFIKSLERSGLLFEGEDALQKEMFVDPYVGVSDALVALDNIEREVSEIGTGDYGIDRPISPIKVRESEIVDLEFEKDLRDLESSLGIIQKPEGQKPSLKAQVDLEMFGRESSDEEILESISFLESEDIDFVSSKLEELSGKIELEKSKLPELVSKRESVLEEYNQAKDDFEKFRKKWKYYEKIGQYEKSREAKSKMAEARNIVGGVIKPELKREVMSGAVFPYEGTYMEKMAPIMGSIQRLESEREKLGR